MLGNRDNTFGGQQRPSLFAKTKAILANTLGALAGFFGTPIGYVLSEPYVVQFTQKYYWDWLSYPARWALFAAIALLLFGLTRLVFDNGVSLALGLLHARRG